MTVEELLAATLANVREGQPIMEAMVGHGTQGDTFLAATRALVMALPDDLGVDDKGTPLRFPMPLAEIPQRFIEQALEDALKEVRSDGTTS